MFSRIFDRTRKEAGHKGQNPSLSSLSIAASLTATLSILILPATTSAEPSYLTQWGNHSSGTAQPTLLKASSSHSSSKGVQITKKKKRGKLRTVGFRGPVEEFDNPGYKLAPTVYLCKKQKIRTTLYYWEVQDPVWGPVWKTLGRVTVKANKKTKLYMAESERLEKTHDICILLDSILPMELPWNDGPMIYVDYKTRMQGTITKKRVRKLLRKPAYSIRAVIPASLPNSNGVLK